MILWKNYFTIRKKNYGTMEKLCYYTENYGTMIYKGEKQGRLPKTMELGFIMEKSMVKYQNKFLNKKID